MELADFFDSHEDMENMLALAEERVMPLITWLDEMEPGEHQAKVSTAVFILMTVRAVRIHGLQPETAKAIAYDLVMNIRGLNRLAN